MQAGGTKKSSISGAHPAENRNMSWVTIILGPVRGSHLGGGAFVDLVAATGGLSSCALKASKMIFTGKEAVQNLAGAVLQFQPKIVLTLKEGLITLFY